MSTQSDAGFSHRIVLPAHERFVPWRRIVGLVLSAKLGSGPGGEEEDANLEFGFRLATARMEVEAGLIAALKDGRLTLRGPDSHFPVTQPVMRPDDAVVARVELAEFLASYGVSVEEVPEAAVLPEAAVEAGAKASVVHTLAARRNVLDPVIDLAEKKATNANDRAAVWNALTALAMATDRLHPLRGFTEEKCIQWLDGDKPKFLTRDAFNKRWNNRKGKAAANRR